MLRPIGHTTIQGYLAYKKATPPGRKDKFATDDVKYLFHQIDEEWKNQVRPITLKPRVEGNKSL